MFFKYTEDLYTIGISNDILGKFYSHLQEGILKKEDKDTLCKRGNSLEKFAKKATCFEKCKWNI